MREHVLFIAPSYMNLYKDIIEEMERQNYVVDYIAEKSFKDDPLNKRGNGRFGKWWVRPEAFERKINQYWRDILSEKRYSKTYDILFVLDGQSLRKVVFDILKERNSALKSVNYLFDSTGIYQFDRNFKYFDQVYTFDREDAKQYHLNLLPIYYVNQDVDSDYHYDIFGMGAIQEERYQVFKKIAGIAKREGLTYYLKLFVFFSVRSKILYQFRCKIYNMMGMKTISLDAMQSEFATYESMSPIEFREYIYSSDIIIDTCAAHQKGLTARFMWALGAGKKIITNNAESKYYPFYDENQILILGEGHSFEEFLTRSFVPSMEKQKTIVAFRIDNWLHKILYFR